MGRAGFEDVAVGDRLDVVHRAGGDPERVAGGEAHVEPLNLGERVRELRRSLGWTLEEAANRAGLARSTLSKIENGQMSPTYDALKKLDK